MELWNIKLIIVHEPEIRVDLNGILEICSRSY